jgi:diamine N-acetyltransferase
MSRLDIQRGTTADAALLSEFAARTFAETFAADNRPEDLAAHLAASFGVAQQAAELADPDVVTLLARRAGVLVAFAQLRRIAPPACVTHEHAVELRRFYVDRPAQGSGVAAELMAWARTVARDFGARHLWLGVWERNARAIAFYTRAGFARVGSHDFFVGPDRQTDYVLVAPVAGAIDRVALREITADTVRAVTVLAVHPSQRQQVATNAESLSQALFAPEAWYRAIYADDEPAGFVMLYDETLRAVPPPAPQVAVWRFMVDGRFQGRGVGRAAMNEVIAHACRKGLFRTLELSYVPGPASPERFYLKLGFRHTGRVDEGEVVLELPLAAIEREASSTG